MNPTPLLQGALSITILANLTLAYDTWRHRQHRWNTWHYHATTRRWGIGPVGHHTWRGTIGISIVLAGHGYALHRWPENPDRSSSESRA
jgi:hypothetical protein